MLLEDITVINSMLLFVFVEDTSAIFGNSLEKQRS